MKIKLLALDLDGTTLRSDNTLSPSVKRAITTAIENGIEVVAASGRPYGSMPKSVLEIEGLNYVIASNGAAIYDRHGKRIHSVLLKDLQVTKLLALTEEHDLIWEAFQEGETCTDKRYYDNPLQYGCSAAYVDYVRSSRGCSDNMREYIFKHRKNLDSVEFVCADDSLRNSVRELLEKQLEGVYITSSSKNFVEFMDKDATKSNGVRWLCKKLGINIKYTAACGNADNDVDMIAQAGMGAAVANACKSCKDCADIIVSANDDDGVAELINIILNTD